ncbi:zinc-binding dehydrogenase [Halobacteriales archaeon Cl-PHB]
MRAIRHHSYGSTEVLELEDVTDPEPGPNDLLVEVRAAGVNPLDFVYRKGVVEPAALPAVPGSDLAGVVTATGEAVDRFETGDRVFATGQAANPAAGYAELAVVPAADCAPLPDAVSFEAGGALGIPGATAWRAIADYGDVTPGDTVLVHGGSGGVGHLAVQVAAAAGATVVTTAGSEAARSRLEELGADATLDYRDEALAAAIIDVGRPDIVLDHRLDDYLALDVEVAAQGARIVSIFGEPTADASSALARRKELSLQWLAVSNTPNLPATLERVAGLVADGRLDVHVDDRFDLAAAADAQAALAAGERVGKLVVVP